MVLDSDVVTMLQKNDEKKDDKGRGNQDQSSWIAKGGQNTTEISDKAPAQSEKMGEETRCKVIDRPYIGK